MIVRSVVAPALPDLHLASELAVVARPFVGGQRRGVARPPLEVHQWRLRGPRRHDRLLPSRLNHRAALGQPLGISASSAAVLRASIPVFRAVSEPAGHCLWMGFSAPRPSEPEVSTRSSAKWKEHYNFSGD